MPTLDRSSIAFFVVVLDESVELSRICKLLILIVNMYELIVLQQLLTESLSFIFIAGMAVVLQPFD